MKNTFITCEKTRVISANGGIYKDFNKGLFPLVTCNDNIVEKTKFVDLFGKAESKNKNFNIVNHYLDDTMTCFEELQFV